MANKNETVDDIIAVNRAIYQGCEECSLSDKDVKWFLDLIDSIETAYHREVAELRKCLNEAINREGNRNTCYPRCAPKIECRACVITKWRKALEGVRNESSPR